MLLASTKRLGEFAGCDPLPSPAVLAFRQPNLVGFLAFTSFPVALSRCTYGRRAKQITAPADTSIAPLIPIFSAAPRSLVQGLQIGGVKG